jgi:DTW domain-containing protein YfiP
LNLALHISNQNTDTGTSSMDTNNNGVGNRKDAGDKSNKETAEVPVSSIVNVNDNGPKPKEEQYNNTRKTALQHQHQNHSENNNQNQQQPKKNKRVICERCHRPAPRACICESLPDAPIRLENTSVVVLQHPLELKHKNRSIPILELCLASEHLHLCVGRRLGDRIDPKVMALLQPPNIPILLYPNDDPKTTTQTSTNKEIEQKVVSLTQAIKQIQQRSCTGAETHLHQEEPQRHDAKPASASSYGRIVFLLLDATWKYAREMNQANLQHDQYPPNLMRVSLEPGDLPEGFTPRRFDIRTTPQDKDDGVSTETWMCTAECIARVLSRTEDNPEIYETITKPLDTMVRKWNAFVGDRPKTREPRPAKKARRG